jgi:ornithine cyclodeaminase
VSGRDEAGLVHFTDADVERALHGADIGAALRDSFVGFSQGRAAQQPRLRTEAGGVKLSTLGAVLPSLGVAGAKIYTTIGGQFSFLIALFSSRTGKPIATFEANEITRRRTAAVSVLAASACANAEPRAIAVFGTGVQGRSHAEAFAAAYPRAQMRIVPRGADVRDALAGADIVVTATRAATPIFDGAWVEQGAFVSAVGSSRPDTRELDDALFARTRTVVVEWKEQASREAGDLLLAAPRLREAMNVVELGDVLAGNAQGRSARADIVVFKSVGVGLEDITVAALAYRALVGKDP